MLIGDTAIQNCSDCSGEDNDCPGIAHKFYEMLSSSYVDDLPYSVSSETRRDELITYSNYMLGKFGYSTKGFDGNCLSTENHDTLDGQGHLLQNGLRYL